MPSAEELKQRIEAAIPGASAEVQDLTGGGDHFRAVVSSDAFADRSRFTNSGMIMYGKTTISGMGSTGSMSGIVICCSSGACSVFTRSMLTIYMPTSQSMHEIRYCSGGL